MATQDTGSSGRLNFSGVDRVLHYPDLKQSAYTKANLSHHTANFDRAIQQVLVSSRHNEYESSPTKSYVSDNEYPPPIVAISDDGDGNSDSVDDDFTAAPSTKRGKRGRRSKASDRILHELKRYETKSDVSAISNEIYLIIKEHIAEKGETFDEIMDVLRQENGDGGMHDNPEADGPSPRELMDDCIRLSLLVKAIRNKKTKIALWIVENCPNISFTNTKSKCSSSRKATSRKGRTGIQSDSRIPYRCINNDHLFSEICAPFNVAVECGNDRVVTAMLRESARIYSLHYPDPVPLIPRRVVTLTPSVPARDPGELDTATSSTLKLPPHTKILHRVAAQNPSNKAGNTNTAFTDAAYFFGSITTLEVLLNFAHEHIKDDEDGFHKSVEQGLDVAVEAFLKAGLKLPAVKYRELLDKALSNLDKPVTISERSCGRSKKKCRLNILKSLVKRADSEDKFPKEIADKIISRDLFDVWNVMRKDMPGPGVTNQLLHMAVLHGRPAFVQHFVERYSSSLSAKAKVPHSSNEGGHYPLWYNNNTLNDDRETFRKLEPQNRSEARVKIRNIIVTKMIHDLTMETLTDILHWSNVDDLSFDLSRYNGNGIPISRFVSSIIHHDKMEQQRMLKYEQTLKYVEFPPLDMAPEERQTYKESTPLMKNNREVFMILDWLASKGVTKIIRLVIPDRLIGPHDEIEMARYVRQFRVEVLDWRVLDLALSIFRPAIPDRSDEPDPHGQSHPPFLPPPPPPPVLTHPLDQLNLQSTHANNPSDDDGILPGLTKRFSGLTETQNGTTITYKHPIRRTTEQSHFQPQIKRNRPDIMSTKNNLDNDRRRQQEMARDMSRRDVDNEKPVASENWSSDEGTDYDGSITSNGSVDGGSEAEGRDRYDAAHTGDRNDCLENENRSVSSTNHDMSQRTTDPVSYLTELHLYASGKRSAIYHWFNETDGILSLGPQFKRLHIYVVRETCTTSDAKSLLEDIRMLQKTKLKRKGEKTKETLEKDGERQEEKESSITAFDPLEKAWYPTPSPADLSKIAESLSLPLATWLGKLCEYAQLRDNAAIRRQDERMPKHRPTRVAILDNGVLGISPLSPESEANSAQGTSTQQESMPSRPRRKHWNGEGSSTTSEPPDPGARRPSVQLNNHPGVVIDNTPEPIDAKQDLLSHIVEGRSFVDSASKFCPWQFPSDPHGTQMANLICAMDPLCKLFVARVSEDAVGIKAENVEKAINWAIDCDVDIISMSFVIGDDNDDVKKAVKRASSRGIIMTCSTHDEGSRTRSAYPASYRSDSDCDSVIVLAACDQYGKLLRDDDKPKPHYRLIGDRVRAGIVPFVKSEEYISGSSVSTALAAGLCSLILTCDRLAHPTKIYEADSMRTDKIKSLEVDKKEDDYRLGVITQQLSKMMTEKDNGFISLGKYGRLGQIISGTTLEISAVKHVLEHAFKMDPEISLWMEPTLSSRYN